MRLALLLFLVPGCYLSHGLPGDATTGLRDAPDAPRDTPTTCAAADRCNPAMTLRDGICAPPRRALEDGFEDALVSFGNPVGTVLSCWTVVAGDADIVSDGAGFIGPSDTGRNALDLNGWTSGTIERAVRVVPGRAYRLRFAYTRNPQIELPAATGNLQVDGIGAVALIAAEPNTASSLMWRHLELEFVAAGPTTTIRFASTNPGNGGLYLDSVSVDEL